FDAAAAVPGIHRLHGQLRSLQTSTRRRAEGAGLLPPCHQPSQRRVMAVRLREWLHRHAKIFFILPAVVWLLAFTIFPLLYSLYLSFHGSRFLRPTDFIGFENYHYVLTDYRFWQSLRVTLLFVLVGTAVTVTLGL